MPPAPAFYRPPRRFDPIPVMSCEASTTRGTAGVDPR